MRAAHLGCAAVVAVSLLTPWTFVRAAADQGTAVIKPAAVKAATTRPTTRPSRRSAGKTQVPASVNAALRALHQEYADGKQRGKCNYFTDNPSPELTNDLVVSLLVRRLPQMGGPEEAYVKWQLLSAMPKEVPSQYVPDALAAYRTAPGFEPRPGMRADQKRQLDRDLRKSRDPEEVIRNLNADVEQVNTINRPVAAYRDELIARLPDSYELFEAAIQDLHRRAEAGADVGKVGDDLMQRIRTWAENDGSPRDLRGIYSLLEELRNFRTATYYESFHYERDAGGNQWDERFVDLDRNRRIQETQRAIAARQGGVGADDASQGMRVSQTRNRKRIQVRQTP